MAEVQPKFSYPGLQLTYSVTEAILGGQLVERVDDPGRKCRVAVAGSKVACGVARWDVPVARKAIGSPQVGDGDELTVVRFVVIPVTYAAAAIPGEKLKVAANGQVTPFIEAADTADMIVGECFDKTALGGTGLAVIY